MVITVPPYDERETNKTPQTVYPQWFPLLRKKLVEFVYDSDGMEQPVGARTVKGYGGMTMIHLMVHHVHSEFVKDPQ